MNFPGDNPASELAARGIHIRKPQKADQPSRRAVTDLITFENCARYAHFFSEGRYPTNTIPAIKGHLLHRTIRNLHGRYQAQRDQGNSKWIPDVETVKEEYRVVQEAARTQGLPMPFPEESQQIQSMLIAFNEIEAQTFYPNVQAAELALTWLFEQAPGGPILLEGVVDVVILGGGHSPQRIALWDYKTGARPANNTAELRAYQWQMKLYAYLYRKCRQDAPYETSLYFMRELLKKHPMTARPERALLSVPIGDDDDEEVEGWLYEILEQMRVCEESNQWRPPVKENIPQRICRSCDVRWSCPSYTAIFPFQPGGQLDDLDDDGFELEPADPQSVNL